MAKTDTLRLPQRTGPQDPRAPRALHGYAVMTVIEEISDQVLCVEEGSLYPALHWMEQADLIRAAWIIKENGRRARVYELTAQGRKQLASEEARWTAVAGAIGRVLKLA